MTGYHVHIEKETLKNEFFRKVIFTGKHAQLVLMCLRPKEAIGNEVHSNVDQFFRIEQGEAKFVLDNKEKFIVKDGDAIIVPAGTWHNVVNNSKTKNTVYSPPNHPDGTIHKTLKEALIAEEEEHH
jgi:mannose-6-phosphate isomerase-like protein (cupin superfamily)